MDNNGEVKLILKFKLSDPTQLALIAPALESACASNSSVHIEVHGPNQSLMANDPSTTCLFLTLIMPDVYCAVSLIEKRPYASMGCIVNLSLIGKEAAKGLLLMAGPERGIRA